MHRMPTPMRTHLPVKQFIIDSGILPGDATGDSSNSEHDQADIALLRLPAPNLKGTWKKAYDLLTQIVAQVGWDELLRTRSEVFVMEEEYRMQKELQNGATLPESDDAAEHESDENGADDNASTHALRSSESRRPTSPLATSRARQGSQANGSISPANDMHSQTPRSPEPPASPIPEIRISEHNEEDEEAVPKGVDEGQSHSTGNNTQQSSMDGPAPGVDKPATTHLSEAHDAQEDSIAKEAAGAAPGHDESERDHASSKDAQKAGSSRPSLVDKRLCERWLDNLFMVLYEVSSCVSTLFRLMLTVTFSGRICEFIRSGAPRLHISSLNIFHIVKRRPNGRF